MVRHFSFINPYRLFCITLLACSFLRWHAWHSWREKSILFQFSRTPLIHNKLSEIIKRELTDTSASSLSTHGYIPAGSIDLCMSGLFKWSQTWSSSTGNQSLLLCTFTLLPEAWDSWRLVLPLKSEVKKEMSNLAFPMSFMIEGKKNSKVKSLH